MRRLSLPSRLLLPVLFSLCFLLHLPSPAQAQADDAEISEELPAVSVPDIEPGVEEASRVLQENFEHFLDRHPLGFDTTLFDLIRDDLQQLAAVVPDFIADPASADPLIALGFLIAFIIGVAFVVLFLFLERHSVRWVRRAQARIHFDVSRWLTSLARGALVIVGRTAPIPILILLSFFPVRAVFGATAWPLLLTDALVLFLIFRVVKTALAMVLRLNPPTAEAQFHRHRVETFALILLRVTIFFLLILAAIERFDYHDQLYAFVSFTLRLSLALLPTYLFFIRDSVLELIPEPEDARFYRAFRSILAANYNGLLFLTIILLAFNAAGYVQAATFLLTRGYTLILVATGWLAILSRLREYIELHQAQAEEAGGIASPLLLSIQNWVSRLGTLALIAMMLHFLGLYEPIIALLRVPFLLIGRVEVSFFDLLVVAIIIVASVLSFRVFKTLLNAKIYPALGVEVGAAYAINSLLNYALFIVAFVLCLTALGVQFSAVMVIFASLGVGIGFGLQNITENLISGFILLFGRAVKKGDFITVNNIYGRVEAVGARSVVVRTPDNFSMLIPSKEIVSGRIINWTFHDHNIRVHIPVGVDYDSDPSHVREVLLEAATKHPHILPKPAPSVWIANFGESEILFELLVYFDCRQTNENTLKGTFNFILWEDLRNSGVGMPFPQRDLHLRSIDESLRLPEGWGFNRPRNSANTRQAADSDRPPQTESPSR